MHKFTVGDEVRPSGRGRTTTWPRDTLGVVVRAEPGAVFVQWPGVEDQLTPAEVEPTGRRGQVPPRAYSVYVLAEED